MGGKTYFSLTLQGMSIVWLYACKQELPSQMATPSAYPLPAGQQAFSLATGEGGQVAPPLSPFTDSAKDLYTMSRAQLQRVPPADLLREIKILEERNQADKIELEQLKTFNLLLCQRLAKLKKECVANLYITNDHGLDGLNCLGNGALEDEPEADIRVELSGSQDRSFILIADSVYTTNEFGVGAATKITFHRKDNKVVRPPQFSDIESLHIVAVKPGSVAIVDGRLSFLKDKVPPLEGFGVKILVNGKPLLEEFSLVKPDDPLDDWYYRINPNGIMTLGRSPVCQVSLKELKALQAQARSRGP